MSVQTQYDVPAGSAQWFNQTQSMARRLWAGIAAVPHDAPTPSPARDMDPYAPWQGIQGQ